MGWVALRTRGTKGLDRLQRSSRVLAISYAVAKKFRDDDANLYVVALGWYGFTAIYPLLLIVVTVFGYVGAASLGNGVVTTLHQFPVIGSQFSPTASGSQIHGNPLGLLIGLVGLLYGAQGVTQSAEQAMASVWNVPESERPGFVARLVRSLGGLALIGGAFLLNAFLASVAAAQSEPPAVRGSLVAGLVMLNIALFVASFRVLTPTGRGFRRFLPGAVVASVGFTLLTTVGSVLVQHELRHSSSTYGAFGAIIGVVAFLLLLAKLSIYAAELNTVLAKRLWPRSLIESRPTEADKQVRTALTDQTGCDAQSAE